MAKNYKMQKKKTTATVIQDILFKTLIAIAVIIFGYIAYDKADFSSKSMDFTPQKKSKSVDNAPSDLKWFNDFKGIENVPSKNSKKDSESSGNGFKYEGFKK